MLGVINVEQSQMISFLRRCVWVAEWLCNRDRSSMSFHAYSLAGGIIPSSEELFVQQDYTIPHTPIAESTILRPSLIMSETKPSPVSNPINKWFNKGFFQQSERETERWSITGEFLSLNPKFPDAVGFLGQCKITQWLAQWSTALTFLTLFLSYQH